MDTVFDNMKAPENLSELAKEKYKIELESVKKLVSDILKEDYSNTTFTSQLHEMFGKCDGAIKAYVKPGREFWYYDGDKICYRKLKVTYVRTGVMFFVFEDEPEVEVAWFICSFASRTLYAAQIYPREIGRLLSEYCGHEDAVEDFPKICEWCKWDTCNGRITVEVMQEADDNN
jgi:hypothetical protein